MPHKYPVLTPKQIIKILHKNGFVEISQSGSHKKMSDGKHITIVPMHDKDIKKRYFGRYYLSVRLAFRDVL